MFGPSPFKDYITIYKDKNTLLSQSGTNSVIVRNADNETHFKDVLDTKSMTVDPKTYSYFG